uniref:Surfactant protein C n=1 Tax=Podarcis muralis TaxID=64176 RepID=A0A670J289_PODMU
MAWVGNLRPGGRIRCPVHIKRLLIIVVIVVLIVVIIVGALLMGLYVTQAHTEAVLQMTIEGLEGGDSQLNLSVNMEEAATFYVKDQTNDPATVIYDFSKLLIGYKPWPGHACYATKMDKENIQGLDMILKEFQTGQLQCALCGASCGDHTGSPDVSPSIDPCATTLFLAATNQTLPGTILSPVRVKLAHKLLFTYCSLTNVWFHKQYRSITIMGCLSRPITSTTCSHSLNHLSDIYLSS